MQLPHQILNSCTPWIWIQQHTCMTNFQSNSNSSFFLKVTLDIPFQKQLSKVDSVGLPQLPHLLVSIHYPVFWYLKYLSSNMHSAQVLSSYHIMQILHLDSSENAIANALSMDVQ